MKSLTFALIISLFIFAAPQVQADEASAEQNQEQSTEVECTTSGTYGQNTTCKTKTNQKQDQKVVIRSGKVLGVHTPANTGLDTTMFTIISLVVLAGSVSAISFLKK